MLGFKYRNRRLFHLFSCLCGLFFLCLVGAYLWNGCNADGESLDQWIFFYGWIGFAIYCFILISWNAYSEFWFSPYLLFITFVFLFNYGQFILWALNIHYLGELGTTDFIRYMDRYTLLRIEIISAISIMALHFGALLATFQYKWGNFDSASVDNMRSYDSYYSAFKLVSTPLLILSSLAVLYESYQDLEVALTYGYTAIYYGNDTEINPFLKYISYMFFPSLIGKLIGDRFSVRSFMVVGGIFSVYMFINLLAGDRGSWAYNLPLLYWCYFTYRKKIKFQTGIKYLVCGSVLLICTAILVKFREVGVGEIELHDMTEVLDDLSFVFIKPFFEMGQSARVLGILIQDELDINWNWGNTYIAAVLSMFFPRVKVMFGYPDFYIDNWISQSYLNLTNYGVGFSITAEAFLNGGVFFFWIIMIVMGMFVGNLLKCNTMHLANPHRMFVVLSSTSPLAMLARGSLELNLRKLAYGTLVTLLLVELVRGALVKRDMRSTKN